MSTTPINIQPKNLERFNCNVCMKSFTRISGLTHHLETRRHIENAKLAHDKKLLDETESKLACENTDDNTETNDTTSGKVDIEDEEEDSVVPNQIYPALLQKRALALYKQKMAERRQQAAAKLQEQSNNTNTNTNSIIESTKDTSSPIKSGIYQCGGCSKQLANKSNLNRHERTCADAIELKEKLFAKHKNGKRSQRAKEHKPLGNITININIDNSKNTNNTQNIWNQLNLNPFGYEDISILQDKKVIDKIHGRGLNAFDELLNQIYSLPSNRNIAITNQRKNLAKYINSKGEVKITDQERLLNDLVMNHIDILDEFLAKTIKEIDPKYKRTIDILMKQHDLEDNPNISRYISFAYFLMLNITEDGLKNIGKFKKTVDEYINNNLQDDSGPNIANTQSANKLAGLFKLPQSIRRIDP